MNDYDVVVVGGSLAGCSTARLLALRGAKVALVEKRPDLDAYKVICGHFIQASASPTIERLGLVPSMQAAGALRTKIDIWTRYGWVRAPENDRHGWSLRRSVLDPMLRRLTAETPGVEYLPGLTAVGVQRSDLQGVDPPQSGGPPQGSGRVTGVRVRERNGAERTLSARLLVAADGRDSRLARMAGVPARVRPHGRFVYTAYFEDVPLEHPQRAAMWLSDPDMAYVFPNDQGITLLTVMPGKRRLQEFRGDPEPAVRAHFRTLPDAPDLERVRRVSKWIGKIEMPNTRRSVTTAGMAFVGDAAQSSDPVWGVGCGWAFQSAEWLAEELGGALQGSERELDRGLAAYARRHRRELAAHHFMMNDYSHGRRFSPMEKLLYASAARDPQLGEWLEQVGTRSLQPLSAAPRMFARAARVRLRTAL